MSCHNAGRAGAAGITCSVFFLAINLGFLKNMDRYETRLNVPHSLGCTEDSAKIVQAIRFDDYLLSEYTEIVMGSQYMEPGCETCGLERE